METNENVLMKYKEAIEAKLMKQCAVFVTIGSPIESPRWINLGTRYPDDDTHIRFESTQCAHIWFEIEVSKEDKSEYESTDGLESWATFKKIRTEFLQKNFPTISAI